jgi:hypothetical protein
MVSQDSGNTIRAIYGADDTLSKDNGPAIISINPEPEITCDHAQVVRKDLKKITYRNL